MFSRLPESAHVTQLAHNVASTHSVLDLGLPPNPGYKAIKQAKKNATAWNALLHSAKGNQPSAQQQGSK